MAHRLSAAFLALGQIRKPFLTPLEGKQLRSWQDPQRERLQRAGCRQPASGKWREPLAQKKGTAGRLQGGNSMVVALTLIDSE